MAFLGSPPSQLHVGHLYTSSSPAATNSSGVSTPRLRKADDLRVGVAHSRTDLRYDVMLFGICAVSSGECGMDWVPSLQFLKMLLPFGTIAEQSDATMAHPTQSAIVGSRRARAPGGAVCRSALSRELAHEALILFQLVPVKNINFYLLLNETTNSLLSE